MLSLLALKAEALHLADRTSEALEAIEEADTLVEVFEGRWWCAELHRLRGVFLGTKLGADETRIEASVLQSHQHREAAEVDFTGNTRGSDLRGILLPERGSRYRRRAFNYVSELAADARWRLSRRNSRADTKTGTGEDFNN